MNHGTFLQTLCWILIPLMVLAGLPATCRADNSSDGAAITLGILTAVVVVLFAVSLSFDLDKMNRNRLVETPTAERLAELERKLPLVIQQASPSPATMSLAADREFDLTQNLEVGLRFRF